MSTHSEGLLAAERLMSRHMGGLRHCAAGGVPAQVGAAGRRSLTLVNTNAILKLLISAISRLIFSDSICLQVTETMGREIVGKGDYCIYSMFTDFLKSSMNMIMWMLLNFIPSFSASSAKMGLVETKLAIIPGGGMNCSRSS